MRFIAVILVCYISLVTVTPAVCGTCTVLKQVNLCCNDDKDQSDNTTTCTPCCSLQNCHCNFVAIPQFDFLVQIDINSKKTPIKNDKILSDFLSDCWRPPEII